ncbi:hypothetical protein [Geobacter benzoatilyticus]|uniref:Uncharacterized protein n=1 Tax=Geobacter benzoatilyticus TaxID=2815309 RepID=A0ABX7Q0T2_9BACT|nr:hypothetical protein [Geobacter benzoatilyticus]QSV45012.1 hypothetical protein JZM60_12750 [Geobacter benzoatilyticus]
MDTQDIELWITYAHGCFLGREPATDADYEQAENGNFLALIQVFHECTRLGLCPPAWVMNGLQDAFHKYLEHNTAATDVKDYMTLDKVCGLSRNVFRAMETETQRKELAKRFYLLRWAFGLENKEIVKALSKWGFSFNVTGKEADNPERVYERSEYAQYYETFEKVVEARGYSREETAKNLLETMSAPARIYIEGKLRRRKK